MNTFLSDTFYGRFIFSYYKLIVTLVFSYLVIKHRSVVEFEQIFSKTFPALLKILLGGVRSEKFVQHTLRTGRGA